MIVTLPATTSAQVDVVDAQMAQGERRTFDIPAQPLSTALVVFGQQSGRQVTADGALLRGVATAGVQGSMTVEQALQQLLSGTGLTYSGVNGPTISLERIGQIGTPSNVIPLDPVRVQGYPVPPQAMIDNLPPPYAGGLVGKGSQLGILGNRDFMDTPFNQTSYTSKLMQDQQSQTIGDVLMNDPSVRIENSASSGIEDFNIRGFNVANDDILFTGLPGITPTFANMMMTEGLARVEVLKGPSAFLNGVGPMGSVGGVINTIPKRAGNEPLTQFTPSYTSNAQFGGHIDFARRFGTENEFGARINAVYRNGNTPVDNQTLESRLFTLGLDFRGEDVRGSVDFGYQYQNIRALRWFPTLRPGVPVPAAPNNNTNFSNPWEFGASENFYGVVRGEVDIVDNLTAFASLGGSQRRQQFVRANPVITDGSGTLAALPFTNIGADTMYGVSGETGVRATFQTGPIDHQATIAYNRFWREWRRASFPNFPVAASNIYNPIYSSAPSPAFIPTPASAPKRSENDLSSVAIGDTLSIWQERVQFTLGLRFQQVNAWNFNTTTGAVTSSYNAAATTPMFGLVVKPWQNVSLYANYVQGLQEGETAPVGTVNAGEVFAPYTTQQYEVGIKVDWGKLATTLAAYQVTRPNSFIDPANNIFTVDGQQRNRGLELNVFGEAAPGIRLLGGASFIDARLTQTSGGLNQGNFAVGVPQVQVVAGGEWDLPFAKGLTLLGRLVYTGPAYLDQANLQQVADWALVNIGARYTFERANGKSIVVRAGVNNLFGANYWYATSFGQLSLSSPRTFLLSASFDF